MGFLVKMPLSLWNSQALTSPLLSWISRSIIVSWQRACRYWLHTHTHTHTQTHTHRHTHKHMHSYTLLYNQPKSFHSHPFPFRMHTSPSLFQRTLVRATTHLNDNT